MPAVTICNQNQISCPNLLKVLGKCEKDMRACSDSTDALNNATYIYNNFCNASSGKLYNS